MFWAYRDNASEIYLRDKGEYYIPLKRYVDIWLDRMVVMGKIEQDDWNRENGKYFGIPRCCVEWYIFLHSLNIEPIGSFMNVVFGEDDHDKYQYVRCPKCRKDK